MHEVAIAILFDADVPAVAELESLRREMPKQYQQFLLGPVIGVNGYTTFVMVPDGSKEGWPDSYEMDVWRGRFLAIAKRSGLADIAHVQIEGDSITTRRC